MKDKRLLIVSILIVLITSWCGNAFAQTTPVTQYACDKRSTANNGVCPAACVFVATIEKGCNCFDSADNDGDGLKDAADPDCASYFGLAFSGSGSNCSITPPSGATAWTGVGDPATSSQNTSDTQSKVAVGDIDNDGTPDAVITSKWNSKVRVIATTSNQCGNVKPGDAKTEYDLSGKKNDFKSLGCADVDRLVFEHEVMIADIDRDGDGEIFTIVSNRSGNPESPPTCFFLVAFTPHYKTGCIDALTPMYYTYLGTNRPGSFGIADFDGDGKSEVYLRDRIFAAETGKLLASEGAKAMSNTALWDTNVAGGPVAVDFDKDGTLDLICGAQIYKTPTLTTRSPASPTALIPHKNMNSLTFDINSDGVNDQYFVKLMTDPTEYGTDTHSSGSVADINEDGFLDVVITGAITSGTGRTSIFYWDVHNDKVRGFCTPKSTELGILPADDTTYTNYLNGWIWGTGRVNLGDANGDGKMDLSFIAGSQLFCVTTNAAGNLTSLWTQNAVNVPSSTGPMSLGYRQINDSRSGVLTCTIYDFDNDGHPEMVYRDSQEIVVVDGTTGATKIWSAICQSHTYTEGPVIADMNGDGATDIGAACFTSTSFKVNAGLQQQALGQIRMWYSNDNTWLPTRAVWNQPGYFVVNVNDDLTVPYPQFDQMFSFGNTPCPNNIPGPNQPMNVFMNQVPILSANGCPVFPAPDLAYVGDPPTAACNANPLLAGCDVDGSGSYSPAVVIIPPICGNLTTKVYFNIINSGDLPITDAVPVSFFNGNPTLSPVTAVKLKSETIQISNLGVGATLTTPTYSIDGPGSTFQLYIVLYNDGTTLPINLAAGSAKECSIGNNMYNLTITPDPISATIQKLSDNNKCINTAPNNGSLKVHVFKGATEVTDFSPYSFQWYSGIGTGTPIAGATSTTISALAEGDYTVVVKDVAKGCTSLPINANVARLGNDPTIMFKPVVNQSKCNPADGKLEAYIVEGNTGFFFEWFDIALTPLGISGVGATIANGLTGPNSYVVRVTKDGCTKTSGPASVGGPPTPDVQASVLQHVVDCANPNSGIITADAVVGVVVQPAANYNFSWFYYNAANSPPEGSVLPGAYGTGQTRTGLPVGGYYVKVQEIATGCFSLQTPNVTVTSQTVVPNPPTIAQVSPQTSCDPLQPNGALTATAVVGGAPQNPAGFTFEWFKGLTTLPADKVPAANVSDVNGRQVNKVSGGGIPYTVKVTTPLNCSSTANFVIAENKVLPVVTLSQLTPNSICDPANASNPYNGSVRAAVFFNGVDISATLPNANYTFAWYDGTTTTTPHVPVPADPKIRDLTALADGNYTVVVTRTDLFCVSVPDTEPVLKTAINPVLSSTSTGSNNCSAALTPDGTATVTVTNTAASPGPFTYQWYDGAVVGVSPLGVANTGTTATVTKVGGPTGAPRPYTVKVLNTATGCVNNTTQNVADVSITPTLSTTTQPNSMCAPATSFNGSMTVSVTNIPALYTIADYTFAWYTGTTTASPYPSPPVPATTVTLPKLDVGSYAVVGTNTKTGCVSAIATNVVANTKKIPSLVPSSTGSNNCVNNPPGINPDGTVTVATTVAVGPFNYQWYKGSGDPIAGALPVVPIANNGQSITATGLGGPVGAPTSYTVLVTDQITGCNNFTTTAVSDVSVIPVLSTTTQPNSICAPATSFNGSMTVGVTNIPALYTIADYTFQWYNGTTTTAPNLHNPQPSPTTSVTMPTLNNGTYSVIGTNTKTGCVSVKASNTVANQKVFPTLTPSSTGSNNCTNVGINPDGTATVTVSAPGAPATFTYQWYLGSGDPIAGAFPTIPAANNGTSATATGLGGPVGAPVSYTALVTIVGTGCTSYSTAAVADISSIPVLSTASTPNSVCAPAAARNGTMTVGVTNIPAGFVIGDYTFEWYNGSTTTTLHNPQPSPATSLTMPNLNNGNFTVVGTNTKTGCVSVKATKAVANAKVFPTLTPSSTGSNNCVNNPGAGINPDGTATVTVNTPVGPSFTYQWYVGNGDPVAGGFPTVPAANNGTSATATGLGGPVGAPISYTALVTIVGTGCTDFSTAVVADNSSLPVLSTTTQPNSICSPATSFNGSMTVGVTNIPAGYVIGDYTFAWFTGTTTATPYPTPPVPATTLTLPKLDVASYTVVGTNTKTGCVSVKATNAVGNGKVFPTLTPSSTGSNNCTVAAGHDGTTTVTVNTPVGPSFTYQWYTGTGNPITTPLTSIPGATSATATGLAGLGGPFSYTALVTIQGTGCTNYSTATVADASSIPVLSTSTQPNSMCIPGSFSGSMTVGVTNIPAGFVIGDYTFQWYDGTSAVPANLHSPQPSPATTLTLPTLDVASYSVVGTNTKTGCISVKATNAVANQKVFPVLAATSTGSHNCTNVGVNPDGTATVAVTVAAPAFTFQWYDGAVNPGVGSPTQIPVAQGGKTATATGLGGPVGAPKSYTILVTKTSTGCSAYTSVSVADISAKPTFTITPQNNTVCNTAPTIVGGPATFNGQVLVSGETHPVAGGTYTYAWFDVDPVTSALTSRAGSTATLTQLDNAKYAATITRVEFGCTSDPQTAEVLDAPAAVTITTSVTPSTNCSPAKPGNGNAIVTAPLGANIRYQWYDGTTIDPAKLRAGDTDVDVNAVGNDIQGGTTIANKYAVLVTNLTDGCQNNKSVTVTDAKVIPVIAVSLTQNNTVCDITIPGGPTTFNGALAAAVTKGGIAMGAGTFSIAWTGAGTPAGAGNFQFTKLAPGTFTATVTETATGCTSALDSKDIIDNLTYPAIGITVTPQTSCSATPNGKLVALGDGAANTATHIFLWKDGIGLAGATHAQNGTGIIDVLPSADYTVQITSKVTGCISTESRFVPSAVTNPAITFTSLTQVTSCSTPNGSATATITGLSVTPSMLYDIYYVYNSTYSGAPYPTAPDEVKGIVPLDPFKYIVFNLPNQSAIPTALPGLQPGYITAVVVDKNTQCESVPATQQIVDATDDYSIALTLIPSPGVCGTGLGGIDPVVTPLTGTYTYEWYRGSPTDTSPIDFFNNPPDFAPAQLYGDNRASLGINGGDLTISPDTYTLVAKDANGCGAFKTDNVPTESQPVVTITPTPITSCVSSNGALDAEVTTGTSATGYSLEIFEGSDDTGLSLGSIPLSPLLTPLSVASLAEGPYFVKLVDGDNPTCPLGEVEILLKTVLPPVITLDAIDPNTSCDPLTDADGKVTLTVDNATGDVEAKMYQVIDIDPDVSGLNDAAPVTIGTGASGQSIGPIDGFAPPTVAEPDYTITVRDATSQCEADVVITIPSIQDTPDLLLATPTPETFCSNTGGLSDGKAVASLVDTEPTSHFAFTWATASDLSGVVFGPAVGDDVGTAGDLLDRTNATPANWPMGPTTGQANGDRVYYVRAEIIDWNPGFTTGIGCKTAVVQVVIPDVHVSPDMSLTPKFDSFCLATAVNTQLGDGEIAIAADADPATGGQQNSTGGFDYVWTNANAGMVSPQLAQSNNFTIPSLGDGTYQVTATNVDNLCNVVNSVSINPAPYEINVISHTLTDQRICLPDGDITLTQITVDRSADPTNPPNVDDFAATLDAEYAFKWYLANPSTPGTFDATAGQELDDMVPSPIDAHILGIDIDLTPEAGEYQAMGAGTYYVVATKSNPAAIGFGCPALPYRVDVADVHKNPLPDLIALSNTSCMPAAPGEGEIQINVSDATLAPFLPGGGFTYTYTFPGPGPVPLPFPGLGAPNNIPGSGNGNGVSTDADDDHYKVLLDDPAPYVVHIVNDQTGCSADATATIVKNATPVFVQAVTVLDEIMCDPANGDGSITVTTVSMTNRAGTNQDFVAAPAGPQGAIADFDFEWVRAASATLTTAGAVLDATTYAAPLPGNIGAGTYTVTAKRTTGSPGAGCPSAPFTVEILDKKIFPVVGLTPFSNTSCSGSAILQEGEIKVEVTDATTFTPPAGGFTYSYFWPVAATAIAGSAGNDGDGFGNGDTDLTPGIDNDQDHEFGLVDGAYIVQVTNSSTLCVTTEGTSILKNALPVFIQDITTLDQVLCGPDGSLTVTSVSVNKADGTVLVSGPDFNITDFEFNWTRSTAGGTQTTPGSLLDIGTYAPASFGGTALGFDTYTVVAHRIAGGPGLDCLSTPFDAEILDKRVFPIAELSPFSNTSCSSVPGEQEGEITVVVTDATTSPAPAGGFTYDYTWTVAATAIAPSVGNDGDGFGNGDTDLTPAVDNDQDHALALGDGAYTLQVINSTTQCPTTQSATILKNALPVFVQDITAVDQVLCGPDGSLTVTKVIANKSDGTTLVSGVDFPLSDFEFDWSRSSAAGTQTTTGAVLDIGTYLPATFGGTPIGFDTYTIITRRVAGGPGIGCPSIPVHADILDKRIFPVIQLTPFSNTSCSAAPGLQEGEIKVVVTDATTVAPPAGGFTFDYTWTVAATAIAPSVGNDGDGFGNGDTDLTPAVDNDQDHALALVDGAYTLQAINSTTQCPITQSTTILKNAIPVFIQNVSAVDQVLCNPDGSLTVTGVTVTLAGSTLVSGTDFPITDFEFDWTRNAAAGTQTIPGVTLDVATYLPASFGGTPIGFDAYTVVGRRIGGGPGVGCLSTPVDANILDMRIFPVVTLTPFANSSCASLPADLEGEITVEVVDNVALALPHTYTYTWSGANPTAIASAAFPAPNDGDGFGGGENDLTPAIDNDEDHPTVLKEGVYNMTVQSNQSGCIANGQTEIFKNSTPVFTQLVLPTDQVLCTADGMLVVDEVQVIDRNGSILSSKTDFAITDFDFTYSRTTLGNFVPSVATPVTGTQLDNTNYPAIGADVYFVVATRRINGPGLGCSSPEYKVDILNKQIVPVVSLTPFANTSCAPGFFEGELEVRVTDASINLPAPLAPPFTYSYDWTVSATPLVINGPVAGVHDGDGLGGGDADGAGFDNDGDHPGNLVDGAYTLSVTNTQTGCAAVGSATIFKNSTPVFTQLVIPTHQVICNPDGTLLVQEVQVVDRDGNVQSNLTGDFPLSDFAFRYDRGPSRTTVVDNLNPLQPVTQLDNITYPGIGFDEYYVYATRVAGGPGLDCLSAPYKVDIEDHRVFPVATFTSISNSTCNVAKPNGSVTAIAEEQDGTNTDPYTFTWTLNGGPLNPASIQTDTSPTSLIADAQDGDYIVTVTNTVTGCPFDGSFNLILDPTRATPNIIDVVTVDPINCLPSASAEVTKITLGSNTNSSLVPPNANNEVVGPALLAFTYNWMDANLAPVVPPVTTPLNNTLVPGTFYVNVLDPTTDCLSGPKEILIKDDNIVYPVPNIVQTAKQISCLGTTGTAALAATGDGQDDTNPDYSFSWHQSLDLTGPVFAATSSISSLTLGDYSVNVTRASTGCSASALYIVPDDAPAFTPQALISPQALTLCVGLDGGILARVINLDPGYPFPYNYTSDLYIGGTPNLSNPPDFPNMPFVAGFVTNFIQGGLPDGIYTVRITDNNTSCFGIVSDTVRDMRVNPIPEIVQDNPLTNCDPARPNGQLAASADGGQIVGYTFDWYAGTAITAPPGVLIMTGDKLIGQTAGDYVMRATVDLTGCFADLSDNIQDATIEPPAPDPLVERHRTDCVTPDGWVSVTVGGQVVGYSFDWYDGATMAGGIVFNGLDYLSRDIGPYTVTVTDVVTGCVSLPATVEVEDKRIIPEFIFESLPSFCVDTGLPHGTGSIQLLLQTEGVVLDDIVWYDNATNTQVGTGPAVYELFPGVYRAEAVTTRGCTNQGTGEIGTEISPYNGISKDNDGLNEGFTVDCISNFPDNNVKIFNRNGILVFEADGYNNQTVVFGGSGEKGVYLQGINLPAGTYFYIIDKRDGSKPVAGYLELER